MTGPQEKHGLPIDAETRELITFTAACFVLEIHESECWCQVTDALAGLHLLTRKLLNDVAEGTGFICPACKTGEHADCMGNSWCDCQHRTSTEIRSNQHG